MKFGKTLQLNAVPAWEQHYLAYKKLKQFIKSLDPAATDDRTDQNAGSHPSIGLPEFSKRVLAEFQRCSAFLDSKMAGASAMWEKLSADLAAAESLERGSDGRRHRHASLLLELKEYLSTVIQPLENFSHFNAEGIRKILKKFRKQKGSTIQFQPDHFVQHFIDAREQCIAWKSKIRDAIQRLQSAPDMPVPGASDLPLIPPPGVSLEDLRADVAAHGGAAHALSAPAVRAALESSAGCREVLALAVELDAADLVDAVANSPAGPAALLASDARLRTVVHEAAAAGSSAALNAALQAAARAGAGAQSAANAPDYLARRPLHRACIFGHCRAAQLLIDAGAVVDAVDADGRTPLACAAALGRAPCVEALLAAGASPLVPDLNGLTAVHACARAGPPEILSRLMRQMPYSVFAVDNANRTPLHTACAAGRLEAVAALLECASAVAPAANANEKGNTVQQAPDGDQASAKADALGVAASLSSPVRPTSPSWREQGCAQVRSPTRASGETLSPVPGLLCSPDRDGKTPVHHAAAAGSVRIIDMLLGATDRCVDVVNAPDGAGRSALIAAARGGHWAVVERLIAAGADPSKCDRFGWSPRKHAVYNGHLSRCDDLLPRCPSTADMDVEHPYDAVASRALRRDLRREPLPVGEYELRIMPGRFAALQRITSRRLAHERAAHGAAAPELPGAIDSGSVDAALLAGDLRPTRPPAPSVAGTLDERVANEIEHEAAVDTMVLNGDHRVRTLPVRLRDNALLPSAGVRLVFHVPGATSAPRVVPGHVPPSDATDWCKITFHSHPRDVELRIDVIGAGGATIGRAVVDGATLGTLEAVASAPVLNTRLETVGTVEFFFFVITPYSPRERLGADVAEILARTPIAPPPALFHDRPVVVGHRGEGAMSNTRVGSVRRTHVTENTVLSFKRAADAGAAYVELDVQLTMDGCPVVYHNWTMDVIPGLDIPVSILSRQQFKRMSRYQRRIQEQRVRAEDDPQRRFFEGDERIANGDADKAAAAVTAVAVSTASAVAASAARGALATAAAGRAAELAPPRAQRRYRARHGSLMHSRSHDDLDLVERRTAEDNTSGGDSGADSDASSGASVGAAAAVVFGEERLQQRDPSNLHGFTAHQVMRGGIHDEFAALADVFQGLPAQCGCDIELKYPLLEERELCGFLHTRLIMDKNAYVDRVLDCVFRYAGDRHIFFSSFEPDICVAIARKQTRYPVFFLTDAGLIQRVDPRCNSLREAIRFARSEHLMGVICDADVVKVESSVINAVRRRGMMMMTFGAANNDTGFLDECLGYNIDMVCVDHVRHVVAFLERRRAEHGDPGASEESAGSNDPASAPPVLEGLPA